MQRQTVDSTQLKSVGFDEESNTLEIEFQKGSVYQYSGPRVKEYYDGLMAAQSSGDSVGQYFNRVIRHCTDTTYRKV